ncbi:UNVERIFIED_CONTAM: hypothetical protein K2H54_050302 [Gekko kuhli]
MLYIFKDVNFKGEGLRNIPALFGGISVLTCSPPRQYFWNNSNQVCSEVSPTLDSGAYTQQSIIRIAAKCISLPVAFVTIWDTISAVNCPKVWKRKHGKAFGFFLFVRFLMNV